ncbi:MAG: TPM domain-containing protein [Terriglobales bacterium]
MRKMVRVAAIRWFVVAWFVAAWISVAAVGLAAEPVDSLRYSNYVNDFAGVLDASTQTRLNELCLQIDQKAHAQIAVVTVKTLDGQDPVSYAVALYQKWGIGPKSSNRGVLILLATDDHKYWTSVGYGLEAILPDGKVGGFGREAVPLLKNNDYDGAVTLLTTRVATVIAQDAGVTLENQPSIAERPQRRAPSGGRGGVIVVAIILFVVFSILRAIFRGGGRGPGGGSGFWSGLLWAMLFNSMGGGGRGGGYGGGGFGGGGGGGGFGGFGGGSTGGGGAGGSW